MAFIGLRPFQIMMDGDDILVYTPSSSQCVFANKDFCYSRYFRNFTRINTVKNELTHYEPHVCLDTSDKFSPEWYVATESADFGSGVLFKKLGSVDWDGSKWVITQDIIGDITFDVDLFKYGSRYRIYGTVSDDGTYILSDDGMRYDIGASPEDIADGISPKPGSRIRFDVRG